MRDYSYHYIIRYSRKNRLISSGVVELYQEIDFGFVLEIAVPFTRDTLAEFLPCFGYVDMIEHILDVSDLPDDGRLQMTLLLYPSRVRRIWFYSGEPSLQIL